MDEKTVGTGEEHFKVIARIKGECGKKETQEQPLQVQGDSLVLEYRDRTVKVKLDHVFSSEETTDDIFATVRFLASDLINGKGGGLLAYGQTGSGTIQ
jgi:hypothetical protein